MPLHGRYWMVYNNALITRCSLTFWVNKTALHAWYCEAKPSLPVLSR
ncbi:MAG: hypothetical protein G5663_05295 [Serratia symbiotica]|nr:hypothetical protein [Serratia symbiotica]